MLRRLDLKGVENFPHPEKGKTRDLKPIDAFSADLRDVVERVLRLRGFELDEIEERMLDVLQQREWFTHSQLIHLENIEKLYPEADF